MQVKTTLSYPFILTRRAGIKEPYLILRVGKDVIVEILIPQEGKRVWPLCKATWHDPVKPAKETLAQVYQERCKETNKKLHCNPVDNRKVAGTKQMAINGEMQIVA